MTTATIQQRIIPESAHWYTRDALPFYEIEMKTKPGQFRVPSLADARKLNLYPSVTTVMSIKNKPQLTEWLIKQAIMSALTYPFPEGISQDEKVSLIIEDSRKESRDALDIGSLGHACIEGWLRDGVYHTDNPDVEKMVKGFIQFWTSNKCKSEHTEKPFVDTFHGYGGRIDCIGEFNGSRAVFDWKFRKNTGIYDDDYTQLVAYKKGIRGGVGVKCVSVSIDKSNPGQLDYKVWEEDKELLRWELFISLLKAWKIEKGYDASDEIQF